MKTSIRGCMATIRHALHRPVPAEVPVAERLLAQHKNQLPPRLDVS